MPELLKVLVYFGIGLYLWQTYEHYITIAFLVLVGLGAVFIFGRYIGPKLPPWLGGDTPSEPIYHETAVWVPTRNALSNSNIPLAESEPLDGGPVAQEEVEPIGPMEFYEAMGRQDYQAMSELQKRGADPFKPFYFDPPTGEVAATPYILAVRRNDRRMVAFFETGGRNTAQRDD